VGICHEDRLTAAVVNFALDDMTTRGLILEHPSSLEHDPRQQLAEHPDAPERITAIGSALDQVDRLGWKSKSAPAATQAELQAVHDRVLIERIESLCASGGGQLDEDTFVGEASCRAAEHAAGGACELVRSLVGGEARTGFALLRPSGHHAERARSMGFCLYNNVAIAAELALSELGLERVFILDWDVHHGNGTGEIFRHRDDLLFVSIHQAGIYPGTGALADVGSGAGRGYTINLPVPPASDGELWLSLLEHVALTAAVQFRPQLVLISAGFDAHRLDPLADCLLESEDFGQMTCHVRDMAAAFGAPVGAVLEGGYQPDALAESVLATMRALGGEGAAESIAPDPIYTSRAALQIAPYWQL
jgi:acetoin utilization deacetylase AcuC-like enzyme